jgi:hypothetical protein
MNSSTRKKMMTNIRGRSAWLAGAGLAVLTAATTLALTRPEAAHASTTFGGQCIGSYLVLEQGTGAQTLWTFHRDGTLIGSSTGEQFFVFSGQQGSWRPDGAGGTRAVELTFDWNVEGVLEAIARVDITLSAEDERCDTFSGEFEGRLFPVGEDPLEPGETPAAFGDVIVGRRIEPR